MPIDITPLDDPAYDAAIRDLLAAGGYNTHASASRPLDTPGAETINIESVKRVAFLLVSGTRVYSEGGWQHVIGEGISENPDGLWEGAPLPKSAHLNSDLRGHVETYGAYKVAYRECKHCRSNFTTRRPVRKVARWPELCSTECRKARDAQRKRESYSEKER